jgi:hypothetical protein
VEVLFRSCLLVPPKYTLPHGWHLFNAGYAIPSASEDEALCALIVGKLYTNSTEIH